MSQDFDCFSNLNNYLEADADEMLPDSPSTETWNKMPDSENSLLDSPVPSPIGSKPTVERSPNKKPPNSEASSSKDSSFNMSDFDKLQAEYEQMTGVAAKRVRGSSSATVSPAAKPTQPLTNAAQKKVEAAAKKANKPMTAAAQKNVEAAANKANKPMTAAAQKKVEAAANKPMTAAALKRADAIKEKMMQELLAKSRAPPPAVSPSKQEKARIRYAQKKLLSEQKRAEHEEFLLEAFGMAESTTSTRSSQNSKLIRSMLNSLFSSKDCGEYVPPSTVDLTGVGIYARSSRRLQKESPIDLVSSPALKVPGVVTLDSDDEDDPGPATKKASTAVVDSSFDADNYEIAVKIKWQDQVIKEKMRKYQRFEDLFTRLAERENASPEKVVLNLDDRIILAADTPDSIGYNISKFLTGRIVTRQILASSSAAKGKKKKNANNIKLKIQIESRKKPLVLETEKTGPMKLVFIKLSEELKCKPEQIRLKFDGEKVDVTSTPDELDFEGGEILDCRIVD